jgi:hypothetical protein
MGRPRKERIPPFLQEPREHKGRPLTDAEATHPLCRPEEKFDPKSGSCIPRDEGPIGTLECPPGYILNESTKLCHPEDSFTQASVESAAPFKPDGKMERCIMNVKTQLRKNRSGMDSKSMKSTAIAICRSKLKR